MGILQRTQLYERQSFLMERKRIFENENDVYKISFIRENMFITIIK